MNYIIKSFALFGMWYHDKKSDKYQSKDKRFAYHVQMAKYYIMLYKSTEYKKTLKEKLKLKGSI